MKSKKTRKQRKTKAAYEAALFVDNDPGYIADFRSCRGIQTLKVGGREPMLEIYPDSPAGQAYRRRLSPQAQVLFDFFKDFQLETASPDDFHAYVWYDKTSGIQSWHIAKIKTWIQSLEGRKAALILDFDRTISMMEGFYTMGAETLQEWKANALAVFKGLDKEKWSALLEPITWDDMLEYLCGGSHRLRMLQELTGYAKKHSVDVYVLTANSTCSENPDLFSSLIASIHTEYIPILCAGGKTASQVNKLTALLQSPVGPRFAALCTPPNSTRRRESH